MFIYFLITVHDSHRTKRPIRHKLAIKVKTQTQAHQTIHLNCFQLYSVTCMIYVLVSLFVFFLTSSRQSLPLCVIIIPALFFCLWHIQHDTRRQCLPFCVGFNTTHDSEYLPLSVILTFCFKIWHSTEPSYFHKSSTPTWVGFCPDTNFSGGLKCEERLSGAVHNVCVWLLGVYCVFIKRKTRDSDVIWMETLAPRKSDRPVAFGSDSFPWKHGLVNS